MAFPVKRFDVFLVNLDPTLGSEIQKTHIIAPITSSGRSYPTRIPCQFAGKSAMIVLDQLRAVDKARLVKRLGRVTREEQKATLAGLVEMFAE